MFSPKSRESFDPKGNYAYLAVLANGAGSFTSSGFNFCTSTSVVPNNPVSSPVRVAVRSYDGTMPAPYPVPEFRSRTMRPLGCTADQDAFRTQASRGSSGAEPIRSCGVLITSCANRSAG
jgi:hypothetical protein